jgi:hypothetical protein
MRTGRIHLISKDRFNFLFHPNDSILQAYVDKELKTSAISVIVGHLEHCLFCQSQVSRLKETFQRFQEMQMTSDPREKLSLAEGLVKVQNAMQDWRRQDQTMDPQRWEAAAQLESTREQLSEEIGVYLGSKMTQALLQDLGKTLEDNQKFILSAEPMLAAFFGKRAAARVHQITFRIASQKERSSTEFGPNCVTA